MYGRSNVNFNATLWEYVVKNSKILLSEFRLICKLIKAMISKGIEKAVDECTTCLDIGNCIRVKQTIFIKFEEDYKTFRLHAGNSLYAFCIGPELTLEHLYWGKYLEAGYDLRYLSQSCRNSHFNTVEAIPLPQFDGKIILDYETLDEVEKTWKENRAMTTTITDSDNVKNKRTSDILNFQRRRLENYSWRILCKATQEDYHHQASICSPGLKLGHSSMSTPNLLSSPRKNNSGKLEVKFSDPSSSSSSINNSTRNRRAYSSPPKSHSLDQGTIDERHIDINHGKHSIDLNSSNLKNMHSSLQIDTENKNNSSNTSSNDNNNNNNDNIDKQFVDTQSNTSTNKNPWSTIRKRNKNLSFGRSIGAVGKGSLCVEYTDYGTGDFRSPSFAVVDNFNGSNISPLRYKYHAIYRGN